MLSDSEINVKVYMKAQKLKVKGELNFNLLLIHWNLSQLLHLHLGTYLLKGSFRRFHRQAIQSEMQNIHVCKMNNEKNINTILSH